MNVASFISKRVALSRSNTFSGFIIRLSIFATAISVGVMIITVSFTNGFQKQISEKVFSFLGHIRILEKQPGKPITGEELPISQNNLLVTALATLPEVEHIQAFASKYAILKNSYGLNGTLIKGVDKNFRFNTFKQFIKQGRAITFNDSSYSREIIISEFCAKQLNASLGEKLLIYFIKPDGSIRPDKLLICGIYKTGIEDYDKTFAICDLKLIQRLNGWDSTEIGGYEVFINDYKKIDSVADKMYLHPKFPATWDAVNVNTISPNIFDWLNIQDVTRNVLIAFMIIVAVINLITCLLILVLERLRMIGILKTLGAGNRQVQKIFHNYALYITGFGIMLGCLFGLGILYLQKATGFIKLKEEAYYLSEAAVHIIWWQVAAICVGSFIICYLILLIPSIIVRRISPVKAIRFN